MLILLRRSQAMTISLLVNTNSKTIRKFSSIKETAFKNKESYITYKWAADFPTHSNLSYDEIANLSSRSRDINVWFKQTSDEFVLYREAPDWFLAAGRNANDWTKEIQDKHAQIKILNREYAASINKISLESRKKMDALDNEHRDKLISVLGETPELVFELFNSSMLPFETHLKSMELNSKEEAKDFIDKELVIFKENTYRKFLDGGLSSSELVSMLFVK